MNTANHLNSSFPAQTQTRVAKLLVCAALALAPTALVSPARAQSTQAPAAGAQDQYSGVAHPPADDSIVTNDDPAVTAPQKPSPGVAAAAPAPVVPASSAVTKPTDNPDYGIVTSKGNSAYGDQAQQTSTATAERNARLVSRPSNPDYGVVGMVASPSNQLAEGTDIRVRLLQSLSTQHTEGGELFRAQVAADVYKEGRVVIPMGSELRGRVVSVSQGHRLGAHATLRLRPDAVILPDGTAYHLYAQAISSSQPGTRTDAEGGIQPKMHVVKDLAEYGAGTGGGAIVGGVLGGPVGAGAGAIVGAGVVTTHMLLQKPAQAQVEQGAEITFSLTEPMDLLPTRN